MAQKKKKKKKKPQTSKKQTNRGMSRSQKIMAIIGVFIILAMVIPSLVYLFQ